MTRHRQWRSVRMRRRGPTLSGITRQLRGIERQLAARGSPADVRQAIADVFESYGQVAQMREVMQSLVAIVRAHDTESASERAEITSLLVQLRELARKQVRAQEDLARAVGGGDGGWSGKDRRRV